MTTIELKKNVIRKINQISDNEILTEVYKLLEDSFDDSEVYLLSDNHKFAIKTAQDQIKEGKYLSNEEANKEINE